jgi:hypothetical protein
MGRVSAGGAAYSRADFADIRLTRWGHIRLARSATTFGHISVSMMARAGLDARKAGARQKGAS